MLFCELFVQIVNNYTCPLFEQKQLCPKEFTAYYHNPSKTCSAVCFIKSKISFLWYKTINLSDLKDNLKIFEDMTVQ